MKEKIKISLPNNITKEVDKGTTVLEIIKTGKEMGEPVAAIINGEIRELFRPLYKDSEVIPIGRINRIGYSIYARSLSYLFVIAVRELFPDRKVVIDHAINDEIYGLIKDENDRPEINKEEIETIKKRMQEIIEQDAIVEKIKVKKEEAIKIFESYKADDKLSLLKNAKEYSHIWLYRCRGYYDYFYGPMIPSMGYMNIFDVMFLEPGFILMLPDKKTLDKINPFNQIPKLRAVYKETNKWAQILGISNLGNINEKIDDGTIKDVILIGEALHEKKISQIADVVLEHKDKTKIVLISGPSSSGKTTFSKRLSIQLKVLGLEPYAIEADDYFVNRDNTPLKGDGKPDFESIKAMDVKLLNEHLSKLLDGEEIETINYNFLTGQREHTGKTYKMNDKSVLIVEGIHGLNEEMTSSISKEHKYKIYVSALTQLNIDNHNSLFVSDVRSLRRIVRDHRTRGRSAEETLITWPSVRAGEEANVFPYQEEADVMFNSTIIYEMSVLKNYVEPLLKEIPEDSLAYIDANRMLKLFKFFKSIDESCIPPNSIIKEFVGGSCFD